MIDLGEFVRQSVKERFLAKVRIDEVGCWIWMAAKNSQGYGAFRIVHEKLISAHHAAYLLFVGPIPDGQVIRHRCDIKLCVNPEHLLVGTFGDNNMDAVNRDRHKRIGRKLTQEQAEMVKRSRSLGVGFLAGVLNVSSSTIERIWLGKTYNAATVVPSQQIPPSAVNAEGKENGE